MSDPRRFATARAAAWEELDALVREAAGRPERLGPAGVRLLGARYREAAADLARARRRYPGDPVVDRLESLVGSARHVVYEAEPSREPLLAFVTRGYWRRVAERPVFLVVASLFLLVPAVLAAYWAWRDPAAAAGMVPSDFLDVAARDTADFGLRADERAAMSSAVLTNNIVVAMQAFAGGLVLGAGAAVVLAFNGVVLGAVTGLAVDAGNGPALAEFVAAHGFLELSLIVVSGAAGMRMGWALVDPGHRPRAEALRVEARAAVEILLGTAAWFVVAGLVEGFVSPAGRGLATVTVVGVGLAALYWTLVMVRGRPDATDGRRQRRARSLRRR